MVLAHWLLQMAVATRMGIANDGGLTKQVVYHIEPGILLCLFNILCFLALLVFHGPII
jgi:hypothetical protein